MGLVGQNPPWETDNRLSDESISRLLWNPEVDRCGSGTEPNEFDLFL
jgi:hypothetical protein